MKQIRTTWHPISVPYEAGLHETITQHHHAAQFISMVGKQLIPQRDDDSNTSMRYQVRNQMLTGEEIVSGSRMTLNLSYLSLGILNNGILSPISVSLPGLTKSEAFNKLSHILNIEGINTINFKPELHYDMPDHELLHGAPFKENEIQFIEEHIKYRHNARLVLQKIGEHHPSADCIRIWPHHFDTGTILPIHSNSRGEVIRSIGMGWAIPDSMVEEPYFYLSIWSANPLEFPERMPELKGGTWMMPHWQGAILPMSEILRVPSPEEQEAYTMSFFESGLEVLLKEEY